MARIDGVFRSWSLNKKLLALLLVLLLPACGIIIWSGLEQREHALRDAEKKAALVVDGLSSMQERTVAATKQMLCTLAQLPEVRRLDLEACNKLLREIRDQNPFCANILAAKPDGSVFAASSPFEPGINFSDRKHFKQTIDTLDFTISDYLVGRITKVPIISYACPVLDEGRKLIAVIIACSRLDKFADFTKELNLPLGSVLLIADRSGRTLFRWHEIKAVLPEEPMPPDAFRLISGNSGLGTYEKPSVDGIARIHVFKQIRLSEVSTPYFYVEVSIPRESALQEANVGMLRNLSILGVVILVAGCLAWVFGCFAFLKPIERLVAATGSIGESGCWPRTGLPHTPDEMGRLAKSFDGMFAMLEARDFERKQMENELRESKAKLEAALASTIDAVFISDAEGRLIDFNDAFVTFHRFKDKDECIGTLVEYPDSLDIYTADGQPAPLDMWPVRRALRGEIAADAEYKLRCKNTGKTWIGSYSFGPIRDKGGAIVGSVVTARDITERKQAEESLRVSEEKYRRLFEDAVLGIFRLTVDAKIIEVNPAFAKMFGFSSPEETKSQVNDVAIDLYVDPARRKEIARMVHDAKGPIHLENRYRRKDGSTFSGNLHLWEVLGRDENVSYLEGFVEDVTGRKRAEEERERLEDRLRQAQKLEAVGTLAGGIAHDFNNILSPIIGYAQMALDKLPHSHPMRFGQEQIVKAGLRARDLVKQILAFGRSGKDQHKDLVEVSSIVKEVLKLLRASLPSSIKIRHHIESSLAIADPTQIHQVLMNLCTNAAHAMNNRGALEVGLTRVNLSESDLTDQSIIDLKPGAHLKLTVSDTGIGMDKATRERIFDPFFTTKEVGKGTGLGLAVVHRIVKHHDGAITVQSELGKGSTFSVYIPAVQRGIEAAGSAREVLPKGTERILLLDDEESVVQMETTMLKGLGYEVTPETSSLRSLEIFRSRPGEFDLIITDQTMPDLTGIDVVKEIRRIRRDIPVILCTGFSEEVTTDTVKALDAELVIKPFDTSQLAEIIRKVFDTRKK
jgi:PAS domain S-box-containing protein